MVVFGCGVAAAGGVDGVDGGSGGVRWRVVSSAGNGCGGDGDEGGYGGVHRWIEGGLVVGVETWRLG
ncbi:hypothetical protein Tco_0943250, partial [Tanacetum coccineum]